LHPGLANFSLSGWKDRLSFDRLQVGFAGAGEVAEDDAGVLAYFAPVGLVGGLDVEVDLAEGEAVPEADADVGLDEDDARQKLFIQVIGRGIRWEPVRWPDSSKIGSRSTSWPSSAKMGCTRKSSIM